VSAAVVAATREVQWQVTPLMLGLLYAGTVVALAVAAYGIWRRLRLWRLGSPGPAWDQPGRRLRRVLAETFTQSRLLKQRVPGIMHALLFFGFVVLFAATVVVFADNDLGLPIMQGPFYLLFQSLAVDLFGLLVLVGVGIAGYRRYVVRVPRVQPGRRADALLLATLFFLAATGFLLEGMRIAATDDPWGAWSPIGYVMSVALRGVAGERAVWEDVYPWIWILHAFAWSALLAAIPYTKMIHALTGPLNVFFANLGPARGIVAPIDFTAEHVKLGIRTPLDLTALQLLSLDACTECGRCQDACPAFAAGKPLSPRQVILDLRDHFRLVGPQLREAHAAVAAGDDIRAEALLASMPRLAGGVVSEEALWACTTCRACEEACPVVIEHVPLILGLRQNLAMEQVAVPGQVAETIASLEARQHPFRGTTFGRTDWLQGLPVPVLSPGDAVDGFEVLYWVGCAAALDERVQQVARALVKVLLHAGVRFAVLGGQESCCGDFARRTGNEFHYDMLARATVETLDGCGATRIVTHCPHCLQALEHEYRAFGGNYEVVHHSEFVDALIEEGRVRLTPGFAERTTFHDSCYLGRYNDVFEAPRRVLHQIGADLVEMPRSREQSFCCGAGGGHAFFDDGKGSKINGIRVGEAAATGATTLSTGCPFCLTMLEDGVRAAPAKDTTLRVRDFVELVADSLDDDAAALP
jgi:Fe-S oxidoreductase/nitrate reductase gamma subunit